MDWIDEADGVFRGGGVKGLGLAGALLGFAHHPTKPVHKWINVAGASAGAIIAAYLACGHDAEDMVDLLKETPFGEFADFPLGDKVIGGGPNLLFNHGLAHGEKFRDWFSDTLGHATFEKTKTPDGKDYRLKLVACDVTNRRLLILPDDLPRYRRPGEMETIDPDGFEIADGARMSMSIPYFFEPIQLVLDQVEVSDPGNTGYATGEPIDRLDLEHANADMAEQGRKAATFGEIKEHDLGTSLIVDGGTLSNFPVWIFDVDPSRAGGTGPHRPTFGFTLKGGKGVGSGVNHIAEHLPFVFKFGFDIFHTAQEAWDTRFVSHSTRVRTLAVNAGDVGTTEFNLDKKRQQMLVDNGVAAATDFLDHFDLSKYENTYHATLTPAPAEPVHA
jgi:NTE family protein